jgi:hypothetical protein
VTSKGIGKCSRFTLRIPVGKQPQALFVPPADDGERVAPARTRHRILIADDNQDMADSLALYMQLRGHDRKA